MPLSLPSASATKSRSEMVIVQSALGARPRSTLADLQSCAAARSGAQAQETLRAGPQGQRHAILMSLLKSAVKTGQLEVVRELLAQGV